MLVALVGCSDKKSKTTDPPAPPFPITLTEAGLGSIGATTPAKPEAIGPLLPAGLETRSEYAPGLGSDSGFAADVNIYAGKELVAIIIAGDDGNAYAMRIISPRIVSDRGWRTGTTLSDPSIVKVCHCIGDGLVCSHATTSHVGIILDVDCQGALMDGSASEIDRFRKMGKGDETAIATLRGRKVRMLNWDRDLER